MKLDKRTEKRKTGDIGENIACEFLKKRGFEILERNYSKKWGEIDIVTKRAGLIHFIEVKSVTRLASTCLDSAKRASDSESRRAHACPLTPERSNGERGTSEYRPEDNMHPWKLRRLSRAMQTYLLDRKLNCDWQLDLVTVKIDQQNRTARVELIENVII